ncbi:hypothetical protein [Streptomyces lycii]|uniref:Band 7 domain-containing protein n=1 Tax=Streptomyces lycii TaxID=2654337 RepID=A0ABQ7FK06_9ACTN|nr:hypothetical protein [Streptomyces lycii]KAF4408918.1 hypothetical protein GCU69_11575 [Streptomyces lycii]
MIVVYGKEMWEKNPAGEMVFFGAALVASMRLVWRALARARVEIHREGILVIGIGARYWIPLQSVRRVETSNGLLIETLIGDEVPVFAFSSSLIDRGRTVEAAAAAIRQSLPEKRQLREAADSVTRRIDWAWGDLVIVPFILAAPASLLNLI